MSPENIFPKALILRNTTPKAFCDPIIIDCDKLYSLFEKTKGSCKTLIPIVASFDISTTLSIKFPPLSIVN